MKGEEEEIRRTMERVGQQIEDPAFIEEYKTALDDVLNKGKLPKVALKFTDEKIETIYAEGYRLYNAGKYYEAFNVFRLLVFLDPTQARFAMGMASSAHMMKDYEAAVKLYMVCGVIDASDPLPHFHASDCLLQMNDKVGALMSLEMAVARAGTKPQYQIMKDRALLTIDSLKKEILPTQEKG